MRTRSASKSASAAKSASKDEGRMVDETAEDDGGSGDEDQEEYQIEEILDAKHGMFLEVCRSPRVCACLRI